MAEVLSEKIVSIQTEEADFTFGSSAHEENIEDDFDFDLGDDKLLEPLTENGESIQTQATDTLQKHAEQADDEDEIGYEGGGVPVGDENGIGHSSEDTGHVDGDEIDYDEVDLKVTTSDTGYTAAEEQNEEITAEETHDAIDFGFETSQPASGPSEHDYEVDEDENEQPAIDADNLDSHDFDKQKGNDGEEGGEGDEDDAYEETGSEEHEDEEHDGEEYDGGEEAEEMESQKESLNAGLGQLHSPHSVSIADVTVTWGSDVCPLFKTSEVDSPDSFFLEDPEAANYPLSKFLQTIRSGIASWVYAEDEIFIRIDDLGFEFGETTTEALLDQVTFQNLVALHNTLLTNDDATLAKGLHITLGTRPNCLLRLKALVSGAGSGKGLSSFQQTTTSSDGSSEDEDSVDKSDESPENDFFDGAEEDEGEGEGEGDVLTPEADMADADVAADIVVAEEGTESVGHDVDGESEGSQSGGVTGEDVDLVDFANEEEDDTGGAPLNATGDHGLSSQDHSLSQAGDVRSEQQDNHGEAIVKDDIETVDHHRDSDFSTDFDHAEMPGQDQDDRGLVDLDPNNRLEPIGQTNQHDDLQTQDEEAGNEDDFLDLSRDIDDVQLSTFPEEISNHKAAPDDVEGSLETSATVTLDHDEIDYEEPDAAATIESGTGQNAEDAPTPDTPADTGLDEIDWDDGDKTGAAIEATSIPAAATGKRSRKEDDLEDYLVDDLPGLKRHRTEQNSV